MKYKQKSIRKQKGGFIGKIASHLGAAYMGYKAPSVFKRIKDKAVNTLKKFPGIKQFSQYNKQKAQSQKFSEDAKKGKEMYQAIKEMKYNPFASKEDQINQGTRGSFTFKDLEGKQQTYTRDMTASDTSEVMPMHHVGEAFAKWRGLPNVKPYTGVTQNLEQFFDAPSSFSGRGKKLKPRYHI